ncbi:hypothetical protein J6590_026218 [Homalodisca vitripennis]|nr:hypothetical protein J6590_026218 [Homalodisca vitripennis]
MYPFADDIALLFRGLFRESLRLRRPRTSLCQTMVRPESMTNHGQCGFLTNGVFEYFRALKGPWPGLATPTSRTEFSNTFGHSRDLGWASPLRHLGEYGPGYPRTEFSNTFGHSRDLGWASPHRHLGEYGPGYPRTEFSNTFGHSRDLGRASPHRHLGEYGPGYPRTVFEYFRALKGPWPGLATQTSRTEFSNTFGHSRDLGRASPHRHLGEYGPGYPRTEFSNTFGHSRDLGWASPLRHLGEYGPGYPRTEFSNTFGHSRDLGWASPHRHLGEYGPGYPSSNCVAIERVGQYEYLGVILDCRLIGKTHILFLQVLREKSKTKTRRSVRGDQTKHLPRQAQAHSHPSSDKYRLWTIKMATWLSLL